MTSPTDDVSALSFEDALAQLDAIIGRLEAGSIALDEAITAYERGSQLARHCEQLLERTERRVSALMIGADGSLTEGPLPEAAASTPVAPTAAAPPASPRRAASVDPDDVPF